jgi:hypothetical protein
VVVSPKDRQDALRRYVLGTSPNDELERLDDELSRGAEGTFEELAVAEADLLDAYAAGELSTTERRQVEEIYGPTATGRRRLAFAGALRRKATSTPTTRRPIPAWLPLAAAIAVVALGIALFGWRDHRWREQIGRLERAQQAATQRGERLSRQVEAGRAEVANLRQQLESAVRTSPLGELPRVATTLAQLVLRPGLLRQPSAVPELVLAAPVSEVELALELPGERYASYRVALETPEGRSLWRSERLVASVREGRPVLAVRLPSRVLGDGTYVVTVTGYASGGAGEPAAEYSFRARRR